MAKMGKPSSRPDIASRQKAYDEQNLRSAEHVLRQEREHPGTVIPFALDWARRVIAKRDSPQKAECGGGNGSR